MASRAIPVLLCGAAALRRVDGEVGPGNAAHLIARREEPLDAADDWGAAWAAATGRAAARLRVDAPAPEAVDVVLPAALVLARSLRCPRAVPPRRRRAVAAFAAGEAVPTAPTETAWMAAETGGDADAVDLTVCAARVETVEFLLAALEGAGFRPRAVWPRPLALHAGLPADAVAAAAPQLVLEVDGTSAAVWMLAGGRTWVRSFRLPLAFAGGTDGARQEMLVRELRRTVGHFGRLGATGSPACLWLAGDGMLAEGSTTGLADRLRLAVRPLDAAGPGGKPEAGATAVEAGALMLAARGPREGDLTPPARRAARRARAGRPFWIAAAALLAVALAVPAVRLHREAQALEADRRTRVVRLAPLRAAVAEREAARRHVEALEAEADRVERVLAGRTVWLERLADLEARFARAGDARLERLEVLRDVSASVDEPVVRLRLAGRVRGAPTESSAAAHALIAALHQASWVAGMESPRLERESGGATFDLRLSLRSGPDDEAPGPERERPAEPRALGPRRT